MSISKDFYSAAKERRSYYSISNESVISDERIEEIVSEALKHTPSAFNSQGQRAVVLLGEHHTNLWNITKEALRKIVPAESFADSEKKINSFAAGYGTILFLEDMEVVEGLQKNIPLYAENFPVWAQQSNGMLQFVIWTALESEGFGASLQHYNPLIDDAVKETWQIPSSWKLIAQMPFGKPLSVPAAKEFQAVEDRMKVFK